MTLCKFQKSNCPMDAEYNCVHQPFCNRITELEAGLDAIITRNYLSSDDMYDIAEAAMNGEPLPKEHYSG